jgi:diacylglycerol O-acyltransferase
VPVTERLSAADRASLTAEQGSINMSVGGVLVFDGGPGLRHEQILELLGNRIHLVPKYRKRLAHLAPGVTNPVWVDDRSFDLGWHVRRAALPAPGTDAQLAEFVGHEMSRRLDRSRPLWELTVVEGLVNGGVAIVPKMHHALVDGIAAVDIGMILLDPTTEPLDIPPPDAPWEPRPYDRSRHLRDLALGRAWDTGRLLAGKAGRVLRPDLSLRAFGPDLPRRALPEVVRATELLGELARQRPQAPMTPLNRPIGPNRRYALHSARLDDLKRVRTEAGGTVNDVVLASVTGMLSRYLDAAGIRLPTRPVALVPVNVRKPGEAGGNRISMVFIDLPIDEPDPRERVRIINAAMGKLKESAAVRAGAVIAGATGFAPPLMSSMLARAFSGVRAMNLVVSNVPGPQQPFFLNGARLRAVYPVVPLNPGNQGLSVGVMSYDGGVWFGLLADRDLDPPLPVVADALRDALDELLGRAPAGGRF